MRSIILVVILILSCNTSAFGSSDSNLLTTESIIDALFNNATTIDIVLIFASFTLLVGLVVYMLYDMCRSRED